jgi:hypothetical protein
MVAIPISAPPVRYASDRQGHDDRRNRVGRMVSASRAVRAGMVSDRTGGPPRLSVVLGIPPILDSA